MYYCTKIIEISGTRKYNSIESELINKITVGPDDFFCTRKNLLYQNYNFCCARNIIVPKL